MKLSRRETVFRTIDREPPNKRSVNYGKYIYFIILIAIGVFLLFSFSNKIFYVTGDGQLTPRQIEIQPLNDIRVKSIYVKEGDEVEKGQILFSYAEDHGYVFNDGSDLRKVSAEKAKTNMEIVDREREVSILGEERDFEIAQVENSLDMKKEELRYYRDALENRSARLRRVKRLIYLDDYSASDVDKLQDEIESLKLKISLAEKEIDGLIAKMQNIRQRYDKERSGLVREISMLKSQRFFATAGYGSSLSFKHFTSPVSGRVVKVYDMEDKVTLRGETVMEIFSREEPLIKAFFDQKDGMYITENKKVIVKFPDGSRGDGYIKTVYPVAQPLPPEFQKKYEPVRRSIISDIKLEKYPTIGRFSLVNVKIYVPRFKRGSK